MAEVAMRAQIEASEKKYRLLAEAIPIMVWSANSDGVAGIIIYYLLNTHDFSEYSH